MVVELGGEDLWWFWSGSGLVVDWFSGFGLARVRGCVCVGQQAVRRLDRGLRWVSWMLDLKVFGL